MLSSERATRRQWIAVGGAVLGAFMAVLDVSITNASLQNIQGSLSASIDEGSWIATAYLISEIIIIPLTGWLSQVFSVRRYLLVNAALFLFFSVLCALSWNLPSMIVFRALQGVTGGVLIPVAASIIVTTLPASQRPLGFALFGVSATFAPSIGPTIGGWLTVNYSWEYIFYLNLIPGAILMSAIAYAVDPAPMRLDLLKKGDWGGITAMALFLGCLTFVLEEGNRKDWFGSPEIKWAALISLVSFITFIFIELRAKNPVINLRLLLRRNFRTASLLAMALGMGSYGSIFILPLYLATVQHYDALQIGKILMWVGVPQLFIVPFIPRVLKRVDSRLMIAVGMSIFGISCFMNAFLNHDIAGPQLMWTNILRALGQPLIMTPLSTTAYEGIEASEVGSASGLYNMMRNLGGSIGIGTLGSLLTQRYQFHFSRIAESVSQVDVEAQNRIAQLTSSYVHKGFDWTTAHGQAIQTLGAIFNREANVMAYGDCFFFMACTLFIAASMTCIMKKSSAANAPAGDH